MKRKFISIFTLFILVPIFSMNVFAAEESAQKQLVTIVAQAQPPTHIILDTDMSTDTDDLIAVRQCQQYAQEGLISFDALMLSDENTLYQGRTAAEGILDSYGFPNVIVGTSSNPNIETNLPYWGWLSSHKTTVHNCDTAVRQYRKLLSSGGTYGIIVIGYFDNIWNLIKSQPDDISNETGMQLISEHVKFFDICGTGRGFKGENNQYTGFENNTCFYSSSYTASSQFYDCIGALNIPIYQYTSDDKYIAYKCSVGGKDQLSSGDVVYKAFNGADKYDGGAGWDAICTWLLLPIISNDFSSYGIVPEQYSVTSTWDSATRFTSVPDVNGNVTMLNMTWSGNTYRLYIDDSY